MDIAEKRVYEERAGRTKLALATDVGLAIVGVSGDVIGEFGLAVREPVSDLAAAGDDRLLAAAEDDVLLVELADEGAVAGTDRVVETGAGGADAVAVAGDADAGAGVAIVAGSDGAVRQTALETVGDGADWQPIGDADVREADGRLLAAPDGVYRVSDGGPNESASVDHVGLDDARDVAAAGPLAATGEGLFRLGPGWTEERSGAFDVVAAASGGTDAGDLHAHAASGDDLYERVMDSDGGRPDGDWTEIDWPADAPVAGVAYGEGLYAAARDGTVLADGGDGWRTRSVGLADVRGCAVVR